MYFRMKRNDAFERALKTASYFEKQIAEDGALNGQRFAEAVHSSFVHFAGGDSHVVIQRPSEGLKKLAVYAGAEGSPLACDELAKWEHLLQGNVPRFFQGEETALVGTKWRSWAVIPVAAKKKAHLAILILRERGRFHENERKAASELSALLSYSLRSIRSTNRKASAVAEETRHRMLLRVQADLGRDIPDSTHTSRTLDYSAGTGSDTAGFIAGPEGNILQYVCDVTADDAERMTGLVFLDSWFSIFSQTSLDARAMLFRLNNDLRRRATECYSSVVAVRYQKSAARVEIAGCGNICVVYFSHTEMSVRVFEFGTAAGIRSDADVVSAVLGVQSGDIICTCTDGISGTRKRNGDLYGNEAVAETVRKYYFLSAMELGEKILGAVHEKEEKGVNADDRTVTVLKIE
jgi:hypothetical protein